MKPISENIGSLLSDFYRCPELADDFTLESDLSAAAGYFRVNQDLICYGRLSKPQPGATATTAPKSANPMVGEAGKTCSLPFDPAEVVANLRMERYAPAGGTDGNGVVRRLYYLLRPLMPVGVRKHLQRFSLRGWDRIPFPRWPVDRTVDALHEWILALAMQAEGMTEVPFVWFWPNGYSSCATITHDIETSAGRDFCGQLMDINDSYGIKTSFQVVPEERYEVPPAFLDLIRKRGFEVNVHDLNHDGHLFSTREQFLERADKINRYGKEFGAHGFRSAVLYRRLEWMNELDFAYDMSVPNVAHLDPQRGGCCTLMPYFVGALLELPVTLVQDYSLFHVLNDYSVEAWKRQIEEIAAVHGLINAIVHPDYLLDARAQQVYKELLQHLGKLRSEGTTWIARPGEVNDWWRARAKMRVVRDGAGWRVDGAGKERARLAFARRDGERITYHLEDRAEHRPGLTAVTGGCSA
jgi:hypothetical protein